MAPLRAGAEPTEEVDGSLEQALAAVELRLARLADALLQRDLGAVDLESVALHGALASAVDHFSSAARHGPIPIALRHRLARTSGHVAAHRESFARATAALDRAIDVLLPREAGTAAGLAVKRVVRPGGIVTAKPEMDALGAAADNQPERARLRRRAEEDGDD